MKKQGCAKRESFFEMFNIFYLVILTPMKKIIFPVWVICLTLYGMGSVSANPLYDIVETSDYFASGYKPYKELVQQVRDYKAEGEKYNSKLETRWRQVYSQSIQDTIKRSVKVWKLIIWDKPLNPNDTTRIFDLVWWNIAQKYIPDFNAYKQTYSKNFCEKQAEREKAISAKIDEIENDKFSVNKILAKWAMQFNDATKALILGSSEKPSSFTDFQQENWCENYDGRAMWNGQVVNIPQLLQSIQQEKIKLFNTIRDARGRLNLAKTDTERSQLSASLRSLMSDYTESKK